MPITPVAAGHLPNGKVLLWSAADRFSISALPGRTYTAIFDPATHTATEQLISQTGHDMFCSGISNLADGRLLVNGGENSEKTSLYDASSGSWVTGATMNIPRGYQANTVLQDGSVLTFGGSWSGGLGGKHAEIWTANGGWQRLRNVPVTPALAPDPGGAYRADNHMWLFAVGNGKVLHAGPSANMNWIDTRGEGSIKPAGTRQDDGYSQSGNAVMYDIGKILKVGGAPAYEELPATTNSYVIDTNGALVVRRVGSMAYARIFSNAVVLPNGQVIVIGGQTIGRPLTDDNAVLLPELWDPQSETFTPLPPAGAPRNYHSVALLLPDGRVLSGGGGLCGEACPANHADVQILTPHYLLNADGSPAARPVIVSAPTSAVHGTTLSVRTDTRVAAFALLRLSSVTHSLNNDQRRIPLQFSVTDASTHTHALQVPGNPGITLPGYYMLFALNAAGVPSVAKLLHITAAGAPKSSTVDTQTTTVGGIVNLRLVATSATGPLRYRARGLPPGLSINAATGVISGTVNTIGQFAVTAHATNRLAKTSTAWLWNVTPRSQDTLVGEPVAGGIACTPAGARPCEQH